MLSLKLNRGGLLGLPPFSKGGIGGIFPHRIGAQGHIIVS